MNDDDVIPTSYEQWRHCLEVLGKNPLTPNDIAERLTELQDDTHVKTKEFARLYGTDRLQRTIGWFHRAADELSSEPRSRRHA